MLGNIPKRLQQVVRYLGLKLSSFAAYQQVVAAGVEQVVSALLPALLVGKQAGLADLGQKYCQVSFLGAVNGGLQPPLLIVTESSPVAYLSSEEALLVGRALVADPYGDLLESALLLTVAG
jgi:hypothetical protein